ncbi:hypothetical protein OGATHE_004757 [Ogataea polymorpha]|uniref:Uncharacterized protein n=1 Tax=Ogataea polymorpha TaxID=460523 RepID=A0A9P8T224_9ASCO|nr:hypothetical protein OGATHE_004757 [Ogataea polymorpha]
MYLDDSSTVVALDGTATSFLSASGMIFSRSWMATFILFRLPCSASLWYTPSGLWLGCVSSLFWMTGDVLRDDDLEDDFEAPFMCKGGTVADGRCWLSWSKKELDDGKITGDDWADVALWLGFFKTLSFAIILGEFLADSLASANDIMAAGVAADGLAVSILTGLLSGSPSCEYDLDGSSMALKSSSFVGALEGGSIRSLDVADSGSMSKKF